jgi:hypothetical protein
MIRVNLKKGREQKFSVSLEYSQFFVLVIFSKLILIYNKGRFGGKKRTSGADGKRRAGPKVMRRKKDKVSLCIVYWFMGFICSQSLRSEPGKRGKR